MARTGTNENKEANQQYQAAQTQALNNANEDRANYNKAVADLEAKGNPYLDPARKSTERLLTASASHAQEKGAESRVEDAAMRTGMNTGSVPYWRAALGVEGARAAADTNAAVDAEDYNNAVNWQQWLTGAKLGAAGVDTSLYGTATGGRSNALENLAKLGMASYGPWSAAIGAAGQIGAQALKQYGGGNNNGGSCWIAERIYGVDDNRTHLLRLWLNSVWARTSRVGRAVMTVYGLVGRKVAKSGFLCSLLKPLFERGLVCAEAWKRNALCLEVR